MDASPSRPSAAPAARTRRAPAHADDAQASLLPAEEEELSSAKARIERKKRELEKEATGRRATAESMASRQRDISVSEFFAKNRHLLGFDNPRKALLTTVKEAVDNSLDACEEAGILPDITVIIEDLQPDRPASAKSARYRVSVVDNGPGIVRKQVENVFGRLLYGSKFHRLKMSRGQQGIGISAAGMYGLITTGRPMVIHTRPDARRPAHHIELAMNTKTNRAEVTTDDETEDFPPQRFLTLSSSARRLAAEGTLLASSDYVTGTSVSIELEGRYQKGRGSVDEFLELTAIANPHARITFITPSRVADDDADDTAPIRFTRNSARDAAAANPAAPAQPEPGDDKPRTDVKTEERDGIILFPRAVNELPPETKEIQPHPKGVELGTLLQMVKDHEVAQPGATLYNFLQDRFSRISPATASKLCDGVKMSSRAKLGDVDHDLAEKLFKLLQDADLPPPPTDCLAPIGVRQLLAGMLKGVRAEFYAASSREPAVYRGRPFLIEAAIAFGGELSGDDSARVIRFANRVPLLFQQSACSSFKAVVETNWRNYDLQHPRGALPVGPLVIMIHMASVWVPFTSESKEAIADYDEIRKEMKLALMECGRKLGTYLKKRARMRREAERRDVFERYIGEITKAVSAINGTDARKLYDALLTQAKKRTAVADLQLDEDGKAIKDEDPADQDGVIILDAPGSAAAPASQGLGEVKPDRAIKSRSGDETPSLLGDAPADEPPARRANAKASAAKPGKPAKAAKGDKGEKSGKPAKSEPPPAAAKAAKPKMRLDPKTGKLKPVDDGPGLF
ncbi:MAG: DNA topoisomerase VI subunit B [Phycisphaerales bacterium]|jgi:DNA topoisomerase-6 subunit B|nr:DNA topoisomerase VI subunit B [Phycisphaerales bacterium]